MDIARRAHLRSIIVKTVGTLEYANVEDTRALVRIVVALRYVSTEQEKIGKEGGG